MKAKIGKYIYWIGPYQIAEFLLTPIKWFEKPDEFGCFVKHDEISHKYGKILSNSKIISGLCSWIYSKRKRKISVKIDRWDTWSADSTLGYIILPLLKEFRKNVQGSPYIESEDVPKHLRPTKKEITKYNKSGETDENWHERWLWIIDEMIFAFEQLNTDWEDQYSTGEIDTKFVKLDDGYDYSEMVHGPNHTFKIDIEARNAHWNRMENGFRLFGKYFTKLWN